jgi:hypothetical protein
LGNIISSSKQPIANISEGVSTALYPIGTGGFRLNGFNLTFFEALILTDGFEMSSGPNGLLACVELQILDEGEKEADPTGLPPSYP